MRLRINNVEAALYPAVHDESAIEVIPLADGDVYVRIQCEGDVLDVHVTPKQAHALCRDLAAGVMEATQEKLRLGL